MSAPGRTVKGGRTREESVTVWAGSREVLLLAHVEGATPLEMNLTPDAAMALAFALIDAAGECQ